MTQHISDDQLSAWLEQELGETEATAVETHLRACERCRRELDVLREVVRWASLEPTEWSGKWDTWERIASRISGQREMQSPRGKLQRPRLLHPALAAAVLAGIIVIWPFIGTEKEDDENPAVMTLLAADREMSRSVDSIAGATGWGTVAGRAALFATNREITLGVRTLTQALRKEPGDPVLLRQLGHAVEHRSQLITEWTP